MLIIYKADFLSHKNEQTLFDWSTITEVEFKKHLNDRVQK